jgi:hypothetical protein
MIFYSGDVEEEPLSIVSVHLMREDALDSYIRNVGRDLAL